MSWSTGILDLNLRGLPPGLGRWGICGADGMKFASSSAFLQKSVGTLAHDGNG